MTINQEIIELLTDKSIVLHIITSYILSCPTTTHMIQNQMTRTYSADNYITETSGCAFQKIIQHHICIFNFCLLYLLQQFVH